ncbi:MAG: ComEC/Rec2 family competence protein, partial [Gammaproteobacteria bacterium]
MHQLPNPLDAVESVAVVLASVILSLRLSSSWPLWFALSVLNLSMAIDQRLEARLPDSMSGGDFSVSGWIDSFPNRAEGQVSFSFRITRSQQSLPDGLRRLRLSWYEPPLDIDAGTALDLTVRLRAPRGFSNPGGFDYGRWLFQEGYGATGYVRSGKPARDVGEDLARYWFGVRASLARRLTSNASGENAGALLTALAIGERHLFDDEHWEVFRRTGTSHLVAISGLHIGLIASFAFWLSRRIWLRLPGTIRHYELYGAAVSSLVCSFLYALLAGFGVPAQRALLMLSVAFAAILSRRRISMSTGLSAAAIFVLLWDPFAGSSASFWLSFMAVALLWQLSG